jgi:hypothetical protein
VSSPVIGKRVEVVLIYQSLLGLYGDRGNATVLVKRLAWRGYEPVLTVVEPGDPFPDTGHIYLLGGGEDAAQVPPYGPSGPTVGSIVRSTVALPFSRSAPVTRSSA